MAVRNVYNSYDIQLVTSSESTTAAHIQDESAIRPVRIDGVFHLLPQKKSVQKRNLVLNRLRVNRKISTLQCS